MWKLWLKNQHHWWRQTFTQFAQIGTNLRCFWVRFIPYNKVVDLVINCNPATPAGILANLSLASKCAPESFPWTLPGLHAYIHLCCARPRNHITFLHYVKNSLGVVDTSRLWVRVNKRTGHSQIWLKSNSYPCSMTRLWTSYTYFKEPALAHASSMLTQVVVSGT